MHWESFRPIRDWVLVKGDPRVKKTPGGIHLPEQQVKVERVMEGTGRVLRIGEDVQDVVPGDRICYRGFLKDVSFDQFDTEDDCPVFLLHAEDVLAVIGEHVSMGAFSAPPSEERA